MTDRIERIKIRVGAVSEDGCLVYRDGALLAVFSCEAPLHRWYTEAVFGDLDLVTTPETFADLEEIERWFSELEA